MLREEEEESGVSVCAGRECVIPDLHMSSFTGLHQQAATSSAFLGSTPDVDAKKCLGMAMP